MVGFETRSGAYIWVREHRKRKITPFADRQKRNICELARANHIYGIIRIASQLFFECG